MRFSTVLGNPPFKRNLHLQIIDKMIPHIDRNGAGCFIHPARWFEDPLAEYKLGTDKIRFNELVDRLEDVKILDCRTTNNTFGIAMNSELMISMVRPVPPGKDILLYSKMAQECCDTIVSYSREHNLGMFAEMSKVDGWRVQIQMNTAVDPHIRSHTEYSRKCYCSLFGMNKANVFYNGFDGDTEWMQTRHQTFGKKKPGDPFPLSIKFNTEKEARNFEKSCNTNFFHNIMFLLKWDKSVPYKHLPWMGDYTRPWTDKDYCKFFGALGMSRECQKWMCREVYDYRFKDFITYEKIAS